MIKTDFGGRSFDFNNDETMAEYQELVGKLWTAMEPLASSGSEPEVVAEVIFKAATDGTDQLRYTGRSRRRANCCPAQKLPTMRRS